MAEKNEIVDGFDEKLFLGVQEIINTTRNRVAINVNRESTIMYWSIGNFVNTEIKAKNKVNYGSNILATLSQHLTNAYGKGYSYTAVTRMCKIASAFDKEKIATLSQQLSWSHLIELNSVEDTLKRDFYIQLAVFENWGVRTLRQKVDEMLFERTAISQKPEDVIKSTLSKLEEDKILNPDLVFRNTYILDFMDLPQVYSEKDLENALLRNLEQFILELGNGFAFLERQKRISVDALDYHLDLLFYHRKLNRLVAIDLKMGKFKPQYKAQMELYLRWLEKNDRQEGEEKPIGLLLCSEGNTEHVELLMLDHKEIKVAQYLTELPSKEWFADKMQRALEIAKQNQENDKH